MILNSRTETNKTNKMTIPAYKFHFRFKWYALKMQITLYQNFFFFCKTFDLKPIFILNQ